MATPQVTHFGAYEGNQNAPRGSKAYNLWRDGYYDSRGIPHKAGNVSLTPDLARKHRYGDTVTYSGVTGRYTDKTHSRLSNRIDVWGEAAPKSSSNNQRAPSSRSAPQPQPTPAQDEWTTSPGDRRFLPSVGPTVEINQTSPLRSAGDLDSEPSLFGSGRPSLEINAGDTPQVNRPHTAMDFVSASNPFDEWWKSVPVTGTGSVNAGATLSGDGGSIWSGEDTIGNFGGYRETADFVSNSSLGPELNTDPALLNEGFGYPPPLPPIDETGVNQPPPPQPIGDEWTTTPEDRRFLPESGEPTVQVPRSSGRGGDITSYGTFSSPLTLGAYLNTSLSSMRYGEGYPNTVESADEIRPGATSPNSSTGRMQRWNGQDWEDAGPIQDDGTGTTFIPLDNPNVATGNDRTGTTFIPIQSSTPEGMRIIGHDQQSGQPIYEDAQGNKFVNPGTGRPLGPMSKQAYERATMGGVRSTGYRDTTGSMAWDSRAANLGLMSSQAFGGTPNDNAYSSDEGQTRRYGQIGRLNEFGEYEQTGEIDPTYRSNITYRGLVSGSQRRPQTVSGGRGG